MRTWQLSPEVESGPVSDVPLLQAMSVAPRLAGTAVPE